MKHKARLKGISRCIRRVHLINAFQTGKSNRIGCAFYCDDHVHFHTWFAKRKLPYAKTFKMDALVLKASLDLNGVKFKCTRNTCNI